MKPTFASSPWAPVAFAMATALAGCGSSRATQTTPASAPSDAVVLSAPLELDHEGIAANTLLQEGAATAREEGATPLQVLASGAATEGDRVGGFVQLRKDTCLIAYARGTEEVEDLDVLAFDDKGTSLTADQAIRPTPAIVLCPPHPERVYVVARVASGYGLVALGVQAIAPEQAAAVAIKLGARMSAAEGSVMAREAWPGLSKRIEQRRQALAGRWMILRRLSLPVTPRAESYVSVPLPASSCLDVLVMPNEETRGLRVNIADEGGTIIARGAERGEDRVALVCSPVDTNITIGVRPRRGHGFAAVVLSRSEPGAEAELAIRPDARLVSPMQPLEAVRSRVASSLAKALGTAKVVGGGKLEIGHAVLHRTRVPAGCSRLDVLAGKPVTTLRGSIWAGDTLWATAEGGEQATLYACTDRPTDLEVEVEGQGQPGQHVVELRSEPQVTGSLRAHPLAAGRLLARLNAAGQLVPATSLQDVRALDVDATQRASVPLTVARGSCKRIVAALGPGASGLDLQIVDTRAGSIIAKQHGAHVALSRVCAQNVAVTVEARVSVGTGKTTALVAAADE